jgi:hypothetical protein
MVFTNFPYKRTSPQKYYSSFGTNGKPSIFDGERSVPFLYIDANAIDNMIEYEIVILFNPEKLEKQLFSQGV